MTWNWQQDDWPHFRWDKEALEWNNKDNEITDWLVYFAKTILEAQDYSLAMIDFLIGKTKLYDRVRGQLSGSEKA